MTEEQKQRIEFTDILLMLGIESMLLPQVEKELSKLAATDELSEHRKNQLSGWLNKQKTLCIKRGNPIIVKYKNLDISVFETHENENLKNYYLVQNHYQYGTGANNTPNVHKWILKSETKK